MTIDWQIEVFETLPSTMDVLRERAETGAVEGLVVQTFDQTNGIGRHGNVWTGLSGNIFSSILIRNIDLKDVGHYSFVIAIALAEATIPLLKSGHRYMHKWPNDGMIDGQKFAGILLQTGGDFLNIGVGINLASAPDGKVALNDKTFEKQDRDIFLRRFLEKLGAAIELYRGQGFAPIRSKWLENAQGLEMPIQARLPDETLTGIFKGLDESGALILGLDNGGQRVIHSGEVFFGKDIR